MCQNPQWYTNNTTGLCSWKSIKNSSHRRVDGFAATDKTKIVLNQNRQFGIQCKRLWIELFTIGLYRDVWIAAIASSRTSLATLSVVMCNTSQCKLHSLRVHSGMGNVICIVTWYTLPPNGSFTSLSIANIWHFRDKGLLCITKPKQLPRAIFLHTAVHSP